jgi:2,4-dienoyl-CoA reductase-like NADH-dependent reductase (Old Yellow Enzyme family)
MPSLFDPLPLGELTLKNRILLAPLTRCRAGKERVPNALMAEYYGQRGSG